MHWAGDCGWAGHCAFTSRRCVGSSRSEALAQSPMLALPESNSLVVGGAVVSHSNRRTFANLGAVRVCVAPTIPVSGLQAAPASDRNPLQRDNHRVLTLTKRVE